MTSKPAVSDLLAQARARGIKLRDEGGRLRYEAPRNALTPELKEALRENKEAILEFLRDARAERDSASRGEDDELPLAPTPRDAPVRASYAQTRLWFMHQLAPESPFYNVPAAPRIRGPLEVEALARSLSALVHRHEALRTTFFFRSGELFQRIAAVKPVGLRLADISGVDREAQEREARRIANAASRRPFDLERGPLLRALLIRLGDRDHVLALTLHHIVSDGWSMEVLVRDLFALYRSRRLEPLAVQYADYAVWQRRRLGGALLARHLDFWKRELEGLVPFALTADHARPTRASYRGERLSFPWPASLSDALRKLSRRLGVSLFTTLLAGFQALLHRYTGKRDIVLGCPIASRDARELEELIGFFVNSLVLRTVIGPEEPFHALVTRVAEQWRRTLAHQELPFEKLVEEIAPGRDKTQNPLFQIVFALQTAPALADDGVRWGWADTGATRFDLEAHVFDAGSRLELIFVYATELFERTTIGRLAGHYQRLLSAAVEHPETCVGKLPLMDRDERRGVLALGRTQPTAEP